MADLTADLIPGRQTKDSFGASVLLYTMAAVQIFKGSIVIVTTATGRVGPGGDDSGVVFVGLAVKGVDNSGGAAGALSILVSDHELILFEFSSVAVTDVGSQAYAADSQLAATAAGSNNVELGRIVKFEDSTHAWVDTRIDRDE